MCQTECGFNFILFYCLLYTIWCQLFMPAFFIIPHRFIGFVEYFLYILTPIHVSVVPV